MRSHLSSEATRLYVSTLQEFNLAITRPAHSEQGAQWRCSAVIATTTPLNCWDVGEVMQWWNICTNNRCLFTKGYLLLCLIMDNTVSCHTKQCLSWINFSHPHFVPSSLSFVGIYGDWIEVLRECPGKLIIIDPSAWLLQRCFQLASTGEPTEGLN